MERRKFIEGAMLMTALSGCVRFAGDDSSDEDGTETTGDQTETEANEETSQETEEEMGEATETEAPTDTDTPTETDTPTSTETETPTETNTPTPTETEQESDEIGVEGVTAVDEFETLTGGDPPEDFQWLEDPANELIAAANFPEIEDVSAYEPLLDELEKEFESRREPHKFLTEIDTFTESQPAGSASDTPLAFAGVPRTRALVLGDVNVVGVAGQYQPVMEAARISYLTDGAERTTVVFSGEVFTDVLESKEYTEFLKTISDYNIYDTSQEGKEQLPFVVYDDSLTYQLGTQDISFDVTQADAGVPDDSDAEWIMSHCGDGAFVLYSGDVNITGEGDAQEAAENWGYDPELAERANEFGRDMEKFAYVSNEADDGRVTRSGFIFEEALDDDVETDFIELVTSGSERANLLKEENKIAIEVFWS